MVSEQGVFTVGPEGWKIFHLFSFTWEAKQVLPEYGKGQSSLSWHLLLEGSMATWGSLTHSHCLMENQVRVEGIPVRYGTQVRAIFPQVGEVDKESESVLART